MRTKQIVKDAAWLWLPLFVAVLFALGFYRSFVEPSAATTGVSLCPQGSHLDQFLGCP